MRYFRSRGLRLAYHQEGKGVPVLLVHGFAATHQANWILSGWDIALTGAGFQVIIPDGVGHGESDKPHIADTYKLDLMAQDLIALLDYLGQEQVHIMGYSMGAMIALIATTLWPERFARVIAAGVGENLLHSQQDTQLVVEALLTENPADIRNTNAAAFRRFADSNHQDRQALSLCFAAARAPFPVNILSRIRNPVLVISGDADQIAGAPTPLAELIPGAKVELVLGCDHLTTVASPQYKKTVINFLRDVS